MKPCYRETDKYITIYIPTGRTGVYEHNRDTSYEWREYLKFKKEK